MTRKPKKQVVPEDCMPRCESCAFLQADAGADAGYCRRFPPRVIIEEDGDSAAFPVVEIKDWCGEFRRKVN